MRISVILLDLDGVIRHFDPGHAESVERRHNLAAGSLRNAAFAPDLLEPVITGRMTRGDWVVEVGSRLGQPVAAAEWMAAPGATDEVMLAEVDVLRSNGLTVAILTNGTDTIPAEMVELDLVRRFDAIFNSAEIGFAKPDPRAFEHVCRELAVEPSAVFFTDDSESKLAGAIEQGMTARLFEGVEVFREHLAELGLPHGGVSGR